MKFSVTLKRTTALILAAGLASGCSALDPENLPTPQSLQSGHQITIEVPTAVNLPNSAPVVINGIESGVVEAIAPAEGHTTVRLRLRDSAVVSKTAKVDLRQDTLLGDTYVAIANPSYPVTNAVPAGGTLGLEQALPPVQVEDLMVSLSNFLGSGSLMQLGSTFRTVSKQFPEDPKQLQAISGVLTDTLDTWADNLDDMDTMLAVVAVLSERLKSMQGTLEFALSPAGVDQFRGLSDTTYMVAILAQVGDALKPAMPAAPVLSAMTRLIDTSVKPLLIPGWPENTVSNAELLVNVLEKRLIPFLKNAPGVNVRSLAVQNGVSDKDLSAEMVRVFRTLGWIR